MYSHRAHMPEPAWGMRQSTSVSTAVIVAMQEALSALSTIQ
jgi:hypothetical protein